MSSSLSAAAGTPTTVPSRILARGSGLRVVLAPLLFGVLVLGAWHAASRAR